jgi:hypothetical protein
MGRQPYGMTTPEQRDQAADDSDEAAWQRDCASTARDREAAERDERGEARTQAALQYAGLLRRLLDATSQEPGTDQRLLRAVLACMDDALGDADRDRLRRRPATSAGPRCTRAPRPPAAAPRPSPGLRTRPARAGRPAARHSRRRARGWAPRFLARRPNGWPGAPAVAPGPCPGRRPHRQPPIQHAPRTGGTPDSAEPPRAFPVWPTPPGPAPGRPLINGGQCPRSAERLAMPGAVRGPAAASA